MALALAGCITPAPAITLKVRSDPHTVDSVFAVAKADDIPEPFTDAFLSNLQAALAAHGVKAHARRISDLDLDGVPAAELASYHYVMACHPTATLRNQYVLMSVTMNCALTDQRTRARVMTADVWIGKSTHFGDVGAVEARRGAIEFVQRMEGIALVGPALQPMDPAGPPAPPPLAVAPRPAATAAAVAAYAASAPVASVLTPPAPPAPAVHVPVVVPPPIPAPPVPAPIQVAALPPPPSAPVQVFLPPPPPPPPSSQNRVLYLKVLPDRTVQEVREQDY